MITSIKFGELFQDMLSKFNVVSNTITTADATIVGIAVAHGNDIKAMNDSFIYELNLVKESDFMQQINYFRDMIDTLK